MYIQQAIFTSTRNAQREGYQLVATSSGVSDKVARDLTRWGPSHDSLIGSLAKQKSNAQGSYDGPPRPSDSMASTISTSSTVSEGLHTSFQPSSINFHPLVDGSHCISHTSGNGLEYSGRGGAQVYTQCLVVPRDLLMKFACHPFRLLEAVKAGGHLQVLSNIPKELDSIRLIGRASSVNTETISAMVHDLGADKLSTLLNVVIRYGAVAVSGVANAERLFDTLFDLIPPSARPELTCSTGLKYSPQRPFRCVCVTEDPVEQRQLVRRSGLTLFHINDSFPGTALGKNSWVEWVYSVLCEKKFGELEDVYRQLSGTATLKQLQEVAPSIV